MIFFQLLNSLQNDFLFSEFFFSSMFQNTLKFKNLAFENFYIPFKPKFEIKLICKLIKLYRGLLKIQLQSK